ncbi:MAG: hypothetical protein JW895_13605 [Thermoleophilaceae bacterium]|nr:hypothetical protein [Thermoleophilaceae bacterium]
MTDGERLENLLRSALVPVEPPERLSDRLERTLSELTEAAAEELADLDPAAMKDPRNWARPAAAVVVGSMAGGALVLVRARQRQRKRDSKSLRALEKSVRDLAGDLEKRLRG